MFHALEKYLIGRNIFIYISFFKISCDLKILKGNTKQLKKPISHQISNQSLWVFYDLMRDKVT